MTEKAESSNYQNGAFKGSIHDIQSLKKPVQIGNITFSDTFSDSQPLNRFEDEDDFMNQK